MTAEVSAHIAACRMVDELGGFGTDFLVEAVSGDEVEPITLEECPLVVLGDFWPSS